MTISLYVGENLMSYICEKKYTITPVYDYLNYEY